MTTRQASVTAVRSLEMSCETTHSALNGFTIDRAAAFAGVSVAMLRHYHRRGLVAEPECDSYGSRRYRRAELLRLVQVRTLAGAGVPLTEIGDLLDYLAHVERVLDDPR
ncbi:MerR family transcriptional regulator [Nocardia sp. NBC_01499]|uniref:MerR family transcriptional regulator n=1 Tax=Nocardia sp. NBC_01499 TaxID=2903597 RepID=UPI00386C2317